MDFCDMEQYTNHFNTTVLPDAHGESSKLGETREKRNKLGLSWAKLSLAWGLKLEFQVEV